MQITPSLIQAIGHRGMTTQKAAMWATALQTAADRYQINTPLRLAHWLSQLMHESMGLFYAEEVWGPTLAQRRYEGRADLGNTHPGDGYRFRGRGPIQLTGRYNYRAAGAELNMPLEQQPDLASQPAAGALIAGRYWNSRSLNAVADRGGLGQVEAISAAINGRNRSTGLPNHLPERIERFKQAWIELAQRTPPPQRFVLVDGGGKQVLWDGKSNPYGGITLGDALLAALDIAYPQPGGPWTYGTLKVWRRNNGTYVLEKPR